MRENDTICAIATPIGVGGIGIVRISGDDAFKTLEKIFYCKTPTSEFENRKLYLGTIKTKGFMDKCLAVKFVAPNSFTGEDVVEIHCHGGKALTYGVLNEIIEKGTRLAIEGEFSKRAFINGKMSLESAEGMIEMINAESEALINASYMLHSGALYKKAVGLQEKILDVISGIEVKLDYPEEDVEYSFEKKQLLEVDSELNELINTYNTGKLIREGVTICVAGKPNVGKSSLMNSLLGFERAIVTDVAGTTRDAIEATFSIKGIKFNLVDTAGIHESDDFVEKIGIEKAKNQIKSSDIVIFVADGSCELTQFDMEIYELIKHKKTIVCFNKCDKSEFKIRHKFDCINEMSISSSEKIGIEALKSNIYNIFFDENMTDGGFVLTNERHYSAILRAEENLLQTMNAMENASLDVVAMKIKSVWDILGEITGKTATEEIINNIFNKFCLGK